MQVHDRWSHHSSGSDGLSEEDQTGEVLRTYVNVQYVCVVQRRVAANMITTPLRSAFWFGYHSLENPLLVCLLSIMWDLYIHMYVSINLRNFCVARSQGLRMLQTVHWCCISTVHFGVPAIPSTVLCTQCRHASNLQIVSYNVHVLSWNTIWQPLHIHTLYMCTVLQYIYIHTLYMCTVLQYIYIHTYV